MTPTRILCRAYWPQSADNARVACIRVDESVPLKELALLTLIVTRRRPRNNNGNDNGNVGASPTTNGQCGGERRPTSNDQSASFV